MPPSSFYDHRELLKHVKAGNTAAFTRLFELYSQTLYLNLVKLLRNEQTVEEILPDILLIVWEQRDTITISQGLEPVRQMSG